MQPFLTQFSAATSVCLQKCASLCCDSCMCKKESLCTKSSLLVRNLSASCIAFASLCLPSFANSQGPCITCHCNSSCPWAVLSRTSLLIKTLPLESVGCSFPGLKSRSVRAASEAESSWRWGRSRGGLCSICSFLLLCKHLPAPAKLLCANYLLIQIYPLLTGWPPPQDLY